MKLIFQHGLAAACCCLWLCGCAATGDIAAPYPENTCADVSSHVRAANVKPSDHLALVQKLACYYGSSMITEQNTCSIPIDDPHYFGKNTDQTYGLKDATITLLMDSESYGEQIAETQALYMAEHGVDRHDVDMCLSHMHNEQSEFDGLVAATRDLRRYGY